MNARELIVALQQLDPETVIWWSEYDEYSLGDPDTYWTMSEVFPSGALRHGEIIGSGGQNGWLEDEEDEDVRDD